MRDKDHPEGLSSLRAADAWKVHVGNAIAKFSASIFLLARSLRIPVAAENPHMSWLWDQPSWKQCRRIFNVNEVVVDYCACGTSWRKRTRIIYCHVDLQPLARLRCHGRSHCTFSGRAHVQLVGQDHAGRWLTHIAEPYPRLLCRLLVKQFKDALMNIRVRGLLSYVA